MISNRILRSVDNEVADKFIGRLLVCLIFNEVYLVMVVETERISAQFFEFIIETQTFEVVTVIESIRAESGELDRKSVV